ncbi:MAG: hypothetical protein JWN48_4910 [Myxococcaceae bacterium]|nr:hypothetical protein [Myxococcaceae bacterium]
MHTTIESFFRVRPEHFWQRMFFDAEYNAGLYRALGFESYEVLEQEHLPDGRVRRSLKAEPPLSGPELLKRQLRGRIFYTEEGTYDPARGVWEFVNHSSVAAGSTHVSGTIRVEPDAQGLKHLVELEVRVSALGLGSMIERAIEKSTRESYRLTTDYTNAFAERHGLLAAPSP